MSEPNYMFFSKEPGGIPVNEEENCLLLGSQIPDVVIMPPELGGKVVKVVRAFVKSCPVRHVQCRHLELENGICVAESDKYYWYNKR